jgi:hypothetical protein
LRGRISNPGGKTDFLFTTPVQNGTGAHAVICKMGNGASSRRYSDRSVTFTTHHPSTAKFQTGLRYTSTPLLCLLCRLKETFTFFTSINIVVLNYAQRKLYLLVSITDVIELDGSADDYDRYDLRDVGIFQAQAATGWDLVSVEVKSTPTINYNLQSI